MPIAHGVRALTTSLAIATAIAGLVGVLRHRRERELVVAGMEAPLGNATLPPDPPPHGPLAGPLSEWVPRRPASLTGRAAAVVWASPATAVGLVAATTTGGRWRWEDELGAIVVAGGSGGTNAVQARLGFAANTLGHVIICRSPDPGEGLLAHEAVHVRQTERLGLAILPVYLWLMARWGYRRHPLERAARLGAARSIED